MNATMFTLGATGAYPWVVYAAIALAGGFFALIVCVLIIKQDFGIVKSLGNLVVGLGGTGGASLAVDKYLDFQQVDLTFGEVLAVALLGFFTTTFFTFLIVPVFFTCFVMTCLAYRSGPRCAGLAINHLFLGRNRVEAVKEFWSRYRADPAWDQFAVAVTEASKVLRQAKTTTSIAALAAQGSHQDADEGALRTLLDGVVGPALTQFNAETSHSAWRFSVWRIQAEGAALERIWVSSNYPARNPIPLWDSGQPAPVPASVAAQAMFARTHHCVRTADAMMKQFPLGRMGSTYIAFRVDPLTCSEDQWPWGVLTTDLLHGSIPIESRSLCVLVRDLKAALLPLSPSLKKRVLYDTFTQEPPEAPLTHVSVQTSDHGAQ